MFVWFPRLVEGLIFSEGSSMYQVGGQPVHRAKDLKFSIRSIISKYRYQGKCVILRTTALSKVFNKEIIEGAILTSYKRGEDVFFLVLGEPGYC